MPEEYMRFKQTMETTVTFEHGPLTVELHTYEGDDYQDEVLDLLRFLENNQEKFEEIGTLSTAPEIHPNKTESVSLEEFAEEGTTNEDNEVESESSPLSPIASELRLPVRDLEVFLHVDSDREDPPVFYPNEVSEIGQRQTDRQRIASLMLLYLWHECYGEERVKSSDLKDALELSNISSSGMANMYQGEGDRYFDRRGRGPTATVRLTPPGKRQAMKAIKRFTKQKGNYE